MWLDASLFYLIERSSMFLEEKLRSICVDSALTQIVSSPSGYEVIRRPSVWYCAHMDYNGKRSGTVGSLSTMSIAMNKNIMRNDSNDAVGARLGRRLIGITVLEQCLCCEWWKPILAHLKGPSARSISFSLLVVSANSYYRSLSGWTRLMLSHVGRKHLLPCQTWKLHMVYLVAAASRKIACSLVMAFWWIDRAVWVKRRTRKTT